MSNAIFREDVKVELIQCVGNDLTVARAARISTGNEQYGRVSP